MKRKTPPLLTFHMGSTDFQVTLPRIQSTQYLLIRQGNMYSLKPPVSYSLKLIIRTFKFYRSIVLSIKVTNRNPT